MTAQQQPTPVIGQPVQRLDGHAKVTGQALYAAEHFVDGLLYGVVVSSAIARGSIAAIDAARALQVSGVVDVITHGNRPRMRSFGMFYKDLDAPGGTPFRPLLDAQIYYGGQPVALVLADSFEAAQYAASVVDVHYTPLAHETELCDHLDRAEPPHGLRASMLSSPKQRGDADQAYAQAAVHIDSQFHTCVQHHNPIETMACTVVREEDGHLSIYDKTQGSQNNRSMLCRVFGLSKSHVTVRNQFVGGAFGCGLRPQYPALLAVMAVLKLKRSVRVVLTRQQMFTFGHRPETWQRVRLGASQDGSLSAIIHEAKAETSRSEDYVESVVDWSAQLYRCNNVRVDYQLVKLDRYTPLDMRAPGAAQGMHALEVAMDELAHQLNMDPLALRLKNYADIDPNKGLPHSSKALRACYAEGAARFGWDKRPPLPRMKREGHEWIGWGMATGTWDAMQLFARARAVLHANGKLVVSSAASDIGTGTLTAMTLIAASAMGLSLEAVRFEYGDSTLPMAPMEGGSSHITSVGSAVDGVCGKLQHSLFKLAHALPDSPFADCSFKQVEFADACMRLVAQPQRSLPLADILVRCGQSCLEESYLLLPHMLKQRKYARAAHSAVFAEVRVDEELGSVRVTRVVSAIAAGRIMNPLAARSQIIGGVVWGISQALHEETLSDPHLGRFMNHNLAEYHVAVNADIQDVDVIFVEEDDRVVSRLGAKGVGEIGLIGVSAAISNAIFHATGNRVHNTPMTPDRLYAVC